MNWKGKDYITRCISLLNNNTRIDLEDLYMWTCRGQTEQSRKLHSCLWAHINHVTAAKPADKLPASDQLLTYLYGHGIMNKFQISVSQHVNITDLVVAVLRHLDQCVVNIMLVPDTTPTTATDKQLNDSLYPGAASILLQGFLHWCGVVLILRPGPYRFD